MMMAESVEIKIEMVEVVETKVEMAEVHVDL
jgi:hypothetical protein